MPSCQHVNLLTLPSWMTGAVAVRLVTLCPVLTQTLVGTAGAPSCRGTRLRTVGTRVAWKCDNITTF